MMMGSETEFGIFNGWSLNKAEAIQDVVLKRQCHLTAAKSGVFLANGARVYVDQGKQNEYSTPEAGSPSELVICELAGRRLMTQCAQEIGLSLLCSNLDPVSRATWGTHENYECSCSARELAADLLYPHLATRIIYTGAGGIDPDHPGASLVLSPRASLIRSSYSCQGFPLKTLVFAKPESYCEGFRLHVFCGESLLCHSASYLKYATTALIACCLGQGLRVGPGRLGIAPSRALRMVNRDLSISVGVPVSGGRPMTAFEIQERYLEDVEACRDRLPDWAPLALKRWRQMLEALRDGDASCTRQVDWLVYRELFEQLAADYGFAADELRSINGQLARGHVVAESGRLLEFRAAAHALYVKLHVLGQDSLFDAWSASEGRKGRCHCLPEIDEERVRQAVGVAPAGRAANRGALIKKYADKAGFCVNWNVIHDRRNDKRLDIPQTAGWLEPENWQEESQSYDAKCFLGAMAFRRGEYADVIALLEPVFTAGGSRAKLSACSDLCLSYARSGMKDRAMAALSGSRLFGNPFEQTAFALFCTVNFGLCPPLGEMEPLLQTGEELLARNMGDGIFDVGYDRFVFNQNRAVAVTLRGDLSGAEKICRDLLAEPQNLFRTRMTARTRCYLAKALYLQGRTEEALKELEEASTRHIAERLWGDMSVHSLPLRALLAEDVEAANTALKKAEEICRRLKNPLGLAKILCLKARKLGVAENRDEIRRLCSEVPALRECPVAARVVGGWTEWVQGRPAGVSGPDDYWGIG